VIGKTALPDRSQGGTAYPMKITVSSASGTTQSLRSSGFRATIC
jgi:hypothetical protein